MTMSKYSHTLTIILLSRHACCPQPLNHFILVAASSLSIAMTNFMWTYFYSFRLLIKNVFFVYLYISRHVLLVNIHFGVYLVFIEIGKTCYISERRV